MVEKEDLEKGVGYDSEFLLSIKLHSVDLANRIRLVSLLENCLDIERCGQAESIFQADTLVFIRAKKPKEKE